MVRTVNTVESRHPEITAERRQEWQLMLDADTGESAIKGKGETYLPMPGGFKSQSDQGVAAYNSYIERAVFPEIVAPSLSAMVGMVHAKPAEIELPDSLDFIRERATSDNDTLDELHRRITRNLLLLGRYALLADAPVGAGDPYLTPYSAPRVINWDTGFFVIDESDYKRNGFSWEWVKEHRVLTFEEGAYSQVLHTPNNATEEIATEAGANGRITRVPLSIGNAINQRPDIIVPPMIGVARAARAIYQLSADYRHQLYMSGQETLVAINGDGPTAVGAGVIHEMRGAEGLEVDLKYVSPTCAGIEAHRVAMEEARGEAVTAGARLLDSNSQVQESGIARRLRFASETATIMSVAVNSAALLERGLRDIAMLAGVNEDDVVVKPPEDLIDQTLEPAEARQLVETWQQGGISYQTLYENLQRGGIASAERTFEDELALIDEQASLEDEQEAFGESEPPVQP